MKKKVLNNNTKKDALLNSNEENDCMDDFLDNMDEMIDDEKFIEALFGDESGNVIFNEAVMKEILGDDEDDMFDEFDSESEVPQKVEEHLTKFFQYLHTIKKLDDKSSFNGWENISLFVVKYLKFDGNKKLTNILKPNTLDFYLSDWYMKKYASSKNSIEEQISSLNHYIKFLEIEKIINKDLAKGLEEVLKNDDKYFKLFEEYETESDQMDNDLFY